MGGLKTFAWAVLALHLTGPAKAGSILETFASCTGRFSAEVSHAYLISDPSTEEIEMRRDEFVDLFDAVVKPSERARYMNLRIEAKVAHASLLTQAIFSGDREHSQWARRRARVELDYCAGLLLKG